MLTFASLATPLSIAISGAAPAAYLSPWLWRRAQARRLREELGRRRILALTYDDGPSPGMTPRLLSLLRSFDARAAFFMLGEHVQQYPQLVDRVLADGHDIGCHSDRHLNSWKVTPWHAIADVNAGYGKMHHWLPRNGMFRPPHGKLTLPMWLFLRLRGAPVWWWTIDSGDTWAVLPQPREIVTRVVDQGGGIVLMHDLDECQQRTEFVLETSSLLLEAARGGHFEVRPLRELTA
jgi:peptidoglycan-N-acetylglucosamine deacetylase